MTESSSTNKTTTSTSNRGSASGHRYAAMDIGTNSVKVWVANCDADGFPETVHEEIEITKLGQDLSRNGSLTEEAMERTLATAARFVQLARNLDVAGLTIGATSAVRQARNQEEFLIRARDELKQDIRVINGKQEAELTFRGVTFGRSGNDEAITVFDVGGGSTEFIRGVNTRSTFQKSVPVGSVQLYQRQEWNGKLTVAELEEGVAHTRKTILDHITSEDLKTCAGSTCLIGVGGTIATLAQVQLGLTDFNRASIEGCRMSRGEIRHTSENIFHHTPEERVERLYVKPGRSEYIAGGAAVVIGVLQALSASELQVTCRGLRHGLLIDTFLSTEPTEQ